MKILILVFVCLANQVMAAENLKKSERVPNSIGKVGEFYCNSARGTTDLGKYLNSECDKRYAVSIMNMGIRDSGDAVFSYCCILK